MKRLSRRLLRELISHADPLELLSMGAPADEYEGEAKALYALQNEMLTKKMTQILTYVVFVSYFGTLAGNQKRYKKLGNQIWEALQTA